MNNFFTNSVFLSPRLHSLPKQIAFLFLIFGCSMSWGQTFSGINTNAACPNVGGGDPNWGNSKNWCNAIPTGTTALAQFANVGSSTTINLNMGTGTNSLAAAEKSIGAIELTSANAVVRTISNSSATAGTITLNSTTVNAIANVILQNASSSLLTIANGTGTLGIALGGATNNVINIDGTGGITISSIISGANKLTKSGTGAGILTLSGTNTYTGATTINAGTLSVGTIGNGGVASNLGAATNAAANLVLGGGTLQYTGGTASTDRNFTLTSATTSTINVTTNTLTMSGAGALTTGALTKTGAGTLILSGSNLYTGLTTVSAGILQLSAALPATNSVTVTGGTLRVSVNQTLTNLTLNGGSVTVDPGITLTIAGALGLTSGTLTVGAGSTLAIVGTTFGTSGAVDATNGSAVVAFTNPSPIILPSGFFSGTPTYVGLNGAGGVTLGSSTTIGTLAFVSGKLTLGANLLTVGSIVNANASNHVVTNNTSGALKILGVTSAVFPVGTSTSYNPVTISGGGGVPYQVNVSATAPSGGGITQPTKVLNRTWDITPTGATPTGVGLTFQYNAGEGAGAFDNTASMDGLHFLAGTWVNIGTITPSGAGPYTIAFTNPTADWSPFAMGNAGVLDVELQSLTAKTNGTTNHISWTTTSEKDNAAFSIERSNDGANFASIGTLKGSGTTATERNYSFTDENPLSMSYYRIRQTDNNGATSVSKIVSVAREKGATARFYPSVSKGELTVEIANDAPGLVTITDMTGRTVLAKTVIGTEKLNVQPLANGVYFLSIKANGETLTKKFFKN